ncbi:MAG: DNA-binding response regulator [Epsilonproteobacteria bacterium]|nr:MAG: DNA-binding response regulator [Campylobacterota bacterium]RLA64786.1 MAG: DNA-binding response regulator [Campylobacterota bacterium]
MSEKKILIVEDEKDIAELIHFNLFKGNYGAVIASDGEQALKVANEQLPDLILLDLMIPYISGLEVCKHLKGNAATSEIPIIMITAKGEEEDIIKGLEAGADDYITKPFSPKVLLARVNAVFRRNKRDGLDGQKVLHTNGIIIDPIRRKVTASGTELELTFSEFQIFHLLAQKPGWVFTRSQIVDLVRGKNHAITDRAVDVQIVGLRKKLGEQGLLIETVRGVGYRYSETHQD